MAPSREASMASQSSGSSSGSSSSNPVMPEWSHQLSQIIATLAASLNGWADQQYANGQAITGQTISNFFDQQGQAAGFANNLLQQYQTVFEPLINNFAAKAQSWASEARRFFNMGQAESTAANADQAGMENLKRQLEQNGVNTSSGAMAEIMRKSAMDDARNRTMAGTQAGLQTEQMGMNEEQIAGQMGQNVPGMWATAASVRTAALNAMEQAILGLLNTGVNLKSLPVQAYNAAAAAIKLGQESRSQQQSRQQGTNSGPGQNEPSGGRNNRQQNQPGSNDPSGNYRNASDPRFSGQDPRNQTAQPRNIHNDSRIIETEGTEPPMPQYAGDWWKDPNLGIPTVGGDYDWSKNTVPTIDPATDVQSGQQLPPAMPNTNGGGVAGFGPNQPAVQTPTDLPGKDFDWSQVPTSGNFGQIPGPGGRGTLQPDQQEAGGFDPFGGSSGFNQAEQNVTDPFTQQQEPQQQEQNWQGDNWSEPAQQQPDYSGGGEQGDPYQQDSWQPPDNFSGGDYGDQEYGFAKGGVIPTTGGHVPRSASPSRGAKTDDIPARLNADEFVIPKDVVRHFGTKHFDSLVAKSRKMRTGMAGPKPQAERKPALPNMNRPTFVSKYMGGR